MSVEYNIKKSMGVTGEDYSSIIGKKEPLAHPCNCKSECPYGYGRSYCFPCMGKIMQEFYAKKKKTAVKPM